MKLILTVAEIEHLVRREFNLGSNDKIEIEGYGPPAPLHNYGAALEQALREFPGMGNKIAAIKRMRELCPGLGLAEAKAAVENPIRALEFFGVNKKPFVG